MNTTLLLKESDYKPIKNSFVKLTDEKTFKREIGFAIQIIKKSPYLQKCSAESVLESVYNISQTGLTLNPVLNYAYLIPRKGKCILEPGYQGLIKLATDSPSINSIEVHLVYQGDDVEVDLASPEKVKKHIPYLITGNKQGDVVFGYSVATLADGTRHIEIMSLKQILDVRECSESYKHYSAKQKKGEWASCVWISDAPEMYRKTIVKRHFKYLPKTEDTRLEKAIELDNQDYDFPATFEQGNYIESLLINAAIPEKREREIYRALHDNEFTQKRAEDCIQYLKDNQRDAIESGHRYSQTDIKNKLSKEIL